MYKVYLHDQSGWDTWVNIHKDDLLDEHSSKNPCSYPCILIYKHTWSENIIKPLTSYIFIYPSDFGIYLEK